MLVEPATTRAALALSRGIHAAAARTRSGWVECVFSPFSFLFSDAMWARDLREPLSR